jgi:uncharacterized RmlC-like cupin family protein
MYMTRRPGYRENRTKGEKLSEEVAGATHRDPAEPFVEGDGIERVRLGSAGIFVAKYRVPPGLHTHTNCETVVYVLRGQGYAYYGEDMGDYIEAGPGDFVYIPADLAHVVGCPAGGEALEYVVARNAPEEVVVTLREAEDLPIDPDGKMRDA